MRGLDDVNVYFVDNIDSAYDLKRWLGERHNGPLALDTETSGLRWWDGRLRLVQFGDQKTGWAVPWERWGGVALEILHAWEGEWVLHNATFDAHWLRQHTGWELPWNRTHDTMLQARLSHQPSAALKALTTLIVNKEAASGQQILGEAMAQNGWTWDTVPVDYPGYWAYGALDTVLTACLHDELTEVMKEYTEVYDLERGVLEATYAMERHGARIDVPFCKEQLVKMRDYVVRLESWAKETYGVRMGSNAQLAEKLLEEGAELTARTPKGAWVVDKDVLEEVTAAGGRAGALAGTALKARQATKLASTYLDNFLTMRDGDLLHCKINTVQAKTGRMSITEPPLQTLPRAHENNPLALAVRDCFIPSENHVLYSVDFDQIEYRLFGHFANDPQLLEAIGRGDIHTEMARIIYQDPNLQKKDPRRQVTKNANFAILYGAGIAKFALTAGISEEEARNFFTMMDTTFPGIPRFKQAVEQVVMNRLVDEGQGYVKTPVGRKQFTTRGKEYTAVNYLIQGTAADVLKEALVSLYAADLGPYMVLPVHDEVIFDIPEDLIDDVVPTIVACMTDERFRVPLTVDAEGPLQKWGDKYR